VLKKNKAHTRSQQSPVSSEQSAVGRDRQKGPRKIKDFLGQRGGEEGHVAIPTVTYTSNLLYHLKAEKALFLIIYKNYCINGLMNHLCPSSMET